MLLCDMSMVCLRRFQIAEVRQIERFAPGMRVRLIGETPLATASLVKERQPPQATTYELARRQG